MEENTQTQQNVPFNTNPTMNPQKEGGKGALIGSIIVILLLIVAGAYVWMSRPASEPVLNEMEDASQIENSPDEMLGDLQIQGTSDEVTAIEADVNATNLEDVDVELNQIDAELKAEGL
jgi:uncharacterized membrane protein